MAKGMEVVAILLSGLWFAAWGIQDSSRFAARGLHDSGSQFVDEEHTLKIDSENSNIASVDGSGNVVMRRGTSEDTEAGMGDERFASVDEKGEFSMNDERVMRKNLKQQSLAEDAQEDEQADESANDPDNQEGSATAETVSGSFEARVKAILGKGGDASRPEVSTAVSSDDSSDDSSLLLEAEEASDLADNHASDKAKSIDVGDRMKGEVQDLPPLSKVARMPQSSAVSSIVHHVASVELQSITRDGSKTVIVMGACVFVFGFIVAFWACCMREVRPTQQVYLTDERNAKTRLIPAEKGAKAKEAPEAAVRETASTGSAAGDMESKLSQKSETKKEGFFSSFFKKATNSAPATESYSASRTEKKARVEGAANEGEEEKEDASDDGEDYDFDTAVRPGSRRTNYAESRGKGAKTTVTEAPTVAVPQQAESRGAGSYGKSRKTAKQDGEGGGDDEPAFPDDDEEEEDVDAARGSRQRYRDGR